MGISAPLGLGTSRERAKIESQRFLLARAWWLGRAGLRGELGPKISRWVSWSSYEEHPFLLGFCFQWGRSDSGVFRPERAGGTCRGPADAVWLGRHCATHTLLSVQPPGSLGSSVQASQLPEAS